VYNYSTPRDRSKTNYSATKRRTKTVRCTLRGGRYPHPDIRVSLCLARAALLTGRRRWIQRETEIERERAASDNHFLLPLTKIVVRVEQRLEMSKATRPAWFMALILAHPPHRRFGRSPPVEHNAPIISSPFVYSACVHCLYNVPGVRVISCFLSSPCFALLFSLPLSRMARHDRKA